MFRNVNWFYTGLAILGVLVAVLYWPSLQSKYRLNRLALNASKQILTSAPTTNLTSNTQSDIPAGECHALWFDGFIAQADGNLQDRNSAWTKAIQCDPGLVIYLHALFPEDREMASLALEAQPASAEAWFWTGDLQPENKLDFYLKGLELDPTDGRRWLEVGGILKAKRQYESAIQAYLQACLNGDPGANGCYGAGSIANELGDLETAIRYYRLSKWEKALKLADELEKQLQQQTP